MITNPTHVAVALKYEAGTMRAPVVLAKGYDAVAQKIRDRPGDQIQVVQTITPKWFKAVTEILAAVYRLRRNAA